MKKLMDGCPVIMVCLLSPTGCHYLNRPAEKGKVMGMADELEFVCEKCVHYEVCDRSSRMIWARLSKEKVCTDFMEVVRCKDCRRRKGKLCYWISGCPEPVGTGDDFFCAYGERKDNA